MRAHLLRVLVGVVEASVTFHEEALESRVFRPVLQFFAQGLDVVFGLLIFGKIRQAN